MITFYCPKWTLLNEALMRRAQLLQGTVLLLELVEKTLEAKCPGG
jgi:hypothetical protein